MKKQIDVMVLYFLSLLPLKISFGLSRRILAAKGLGSGSFVECSGEKNVLFTILKNIEYTPTIFDVGANVGVYTEMVFNMRADCKVYAFEPSKRTYKKLTENMLNSQFPKTA